MANVFSGDTNCKAVFNVESGALTTDSKGTNTLTDNNTVQADTTNYKQGACSAYFADANAEYLSRTDTNLDSDFPLKNGTADATISIAFWMLPTANGKGVWSKMSTGTVKGGIYCYLSTAQIRFRLYDSAGTFVDYYPATSFTLNQWYHVAFTYNSGDLSYRIRIWDYTAGALLQADVTGTSSKTLACNDGALQLGKGGAATELDGNMDEIVFFRDILTADEIDQIRGGTYGAGGGTSVSITDTGTGTDVLASILASLSMSDTGAGADSFGSPSVVLPPITDSGVGVDTAVGFILISITETGTGVDALTQINVSVAVSDTGAAYDAVSQLLVTFTLADYGAGVDTVSVSLPGFVSILDAALGSDTVSSILASATVIDAGIGTDTPSILVTIPNITDSGIGVDVLSEVLKGFLIALTDAGVGTDSLQSVSVMVPISDTGSGIDLIGAIMAILSLVDVGHGADVAINLSLLGSFNKLTVTFAGRKGSLAAIGKKGRLTITGKKPGTEFN